MATPTAITQRPRDASRVWTVAWLVWIGEFFAIEGSALFRGCPQDTLSDHVWAWFGVPRRLAPRRSVRVRRIALLWILAWLCSHFLTGDEV